MIQKHLVESINQTQAEDESVHSVDNIPLLDMQDQNFGKLLVQSYKNIGFVLIKNHGISNEIIDQSFEKSREAFQVEYQAKRSLGLRSESERNRGYTGFGKEVLNQKTKGNQKKQTFDLGHPDGPDELRYYPKNQGFVQISREIYNKLFEVNTKIMASLQKGLNLKEGSLVNKCCKNKYEQTLRFLYYPEVGYQQLQKSGKIRAGAHSDYGTITLLFQKLGPGQNGLQALSADKKWAKINPPDYCMVVNLGDLFQHWTNDALKSTIHKVEVDEQIFAKLKSQQIDMAPSRQTIVLFCDPDEGEVFQCLPGFGEPKYQPIDGKKYVYERINSTYSMGR